MNVHVHVQVQVEWRSDYGEIGNYYCLPHYLTHADGVYMKMRTVPKQTNNIILCLLGH